MNLIDATAHVKSQIMAPGGPFEIVDKQVTGQTFKVYANAPINLSQVVNDSRRTDDRNFLVYQEQRLTFKDFLNKWTAWLLGCMLKKLRKETELLLRCVIALSGSSHFAPRR